MRLPYVLPAQLVGILLASAGVHAQAPADRSLARPDTVLLLGTDLEAEEAAARADGWKAPFAVSSSGELTPRAPREVTILGADPVIADGLARRQREADARGGGGDDPEPRTRRPARSDAERPSIHRVARGETWYGIATRYGISPQTLERANPGVDPGEMRVGQLLEIPGGTGDQPPTVIHRVDAGETLWAIARRYEVSPESIRDANGLEDDRLRPDQPLVIPIPRRDDRPTR